MRPTDDSDAIERFRVLRATDDPAVRDELIGRFQGMGQACARRFHGRGEPLDDLEQVAMIGLVKAVDRFDPEQGFAFASFAVPTIMGELLQVARDPHGPALVAEVALELAEDGRDGEARERDGAARVEAVDRLDQAQRRDLDEVLQRLPGAGIAACELARERQESLYQRLVSAVITVSIAIEQPPFLESAHGAVSADGDHGPSPGRSTLHSGGLYPFDAIMTRS